MRIAAMIITGVVLASLSLPAKAQDAPPPRAKVVQHDKAPSGHRAQTNEHLKKQLAATRAELQQLKRHLRQRQTDKPIQPQRAANAPPQGRAAKAAPAAPRGRAGARNGHPGTDAPPARRAQARSGHDVRQHAANAKQRVKRQVVDRVHKSAQANVHRGVAQRQARAPRQSRNPHSVRPVQRGSGHGRGMRQQAAKACPHCGNSGQAQRDHVSNRDRNQSRAHDRVQRRARDGAQGRRGPASRPSRPKPPAPPKPPKADDRVRD